VSNTDESHRYAAAPCGSSNGLVEAVDVGDRSGATMREQALLACPDHGQDRPDRVVSRGEHGFGLPVHDGGSSVIAIRFCPWCGTELGE